MSDDTPETDVIETVAHSATKEEFPDRERKQKPTFSGLPASSDEEFWGKDAAMQFTDKLEVERRRQEFLASINNTHKVKMRGREFVCRSCPFEHTVPLSPDIYTMDAKTGNVIAIDKPS